MEPQLMETKLDAPKPSVWYRFLGALFMETKDGVRAVSLHRVFSFALGVVCVTWWIVTPERPLPDAALYTWWALLGITGTTRLLRGWRENGHNGDSA